MKIALVLAVALAAASVAHSQTYVRPHIRSDGTFVQGHQRSSPDSSRLNNYSSQGNVNPYTGRTGTADPFRPNYQKSYGYQAPRQPRCSTNRMGQYVCR